MTENEFKNKYLPQINAALDFAVNNTRSDFYKKKYQALPFDVTRISTYKEFTQIPLLIKDEILETPLDDRIFTDPSDIDRYTLSAGTTSHNQPLAVPRTKSEILSVNVSPLSNLDIKSKKILILFPPMSSAFSSFFKVVIKYEGISIGGDVYNLKKTARAAQTIGIEGIITTPTILGYFLEELRKIKFELNRIEMISLGGEGTTKQRSDYYRGIFRNANIIFRYGASESGGLRGYRCKHLYDADPNIYHPTNVFLEVVDENDQLVKDGVSGELVHTDLHVPKAFPIIRYKTSDIGSIKKVACKCGEMTQIKLGGRANYDVLRFSGVALHTAAIEDALDEVREHLKPGFQMHVFEEINNGRLMPKLKLQLALNQKTKNEELTKDLIKKSVTQRLYLSADKTLDYFVTNNIFLPLEIDFSHDQKSETKTKSIISHLS
jgi:phenylacetate-coenzyme A ligase PaaK-like adenylate-forming protein